MILVETYLLTWCEMSIKPYRCLAINFKASSLKPLDTIGNYQRQVFSLGVSQHMHKITNPCNFEYNWSSKFRENNGLKKTPLSHKLCPFRCLEFETSTEVSYSIRNYFFLKNYITSEGALSPNVLYTITSSHCSLPSKFLCLQLYFDDKLCSHFHKFVILYSCWDTPSEKTDLSPLSIRYYYYPVSLKKNEFKHQHFWQNTTSLKKCVTLVHDTLFKITKFRILDVSYQRCCS